MTRVRISSDDALLARFVELAALAGEDGDDLRTASYNRHAAQMRKIVDELWARSALNVLLPALAHRNPWVRYFGASMCWEIAEAEAEATLEELGRIRDGTVGMDARLALNDIRAGRAARRDKPVHR